MIPYVQCFTRIHAIVFHDREQHPRFRLPAGTCCFQSMRAELEGRILRYAPGGRAREIAKEVASRRQG
jgi:hypothetical protein